MPPYRYGCLYCDDILTDRTSEHVLQKAFGSNLTLPDDVCGVCNSKVFSPLDDELAHHVRTYEYWDHPDVKRTRTMLQDGHPMWLDENRVWLSVRIDKDVKPIFLTQVVLDRERQFVVFDGGRKLSPEEQYAELKDELRPGAAPQVKTIVIPTTDASLPSVQPALIRSAPGKYVARASTQTDADALKRAAEAGTIFDGVKQIGDLERRSSQLTVHNRLAFDLPQLSRAVAKSALNYLCSVAGPEVARDVCFDEIRLYALQSSTVARGFVGGISPNTPLAQYASLFTVQGGHSLILTGALGYAAVLFVLYGRPFRIVRLTLGTPTTRLVRRETVVVTLVDYARKTHETLSLLDDPARFIARFPIVPVLG